MNLIDIFRKEVESRVLQEAFAGHANFFEDLIEEDRDMAKDIINSST